LNIDNEIKKGQNVSTDHHCKSMVGLKAAATHALSPLTINLFLELSRYYIILRA